MLSIFKRSPDKIKSDEEEIISASERNRLRNTPRYKPMNTQMYGKEVVVSDACTLLSDIDSILKKEVYKFNAYTNRPIIIDCGANIGVSIIYFKNLYPDSVVFGYEADPDLFDLLERNMKNFGFSDVTLSQNAIWVDNNGVMFRKEGGHSGAVIEGNAESDSDVTVPSIRLRDQLDDFDRVDLLKMDIEGAENYVLFDCGESLAKCDHVFVEYHSSVKEPQKLHDLLGLFHDLGYRYHVQEAFNRNRPFVDDDVLVGMDLQLNLFFIKQR